MSLLLLTAAAAALPPICTDRPTKANATCTVVQGEFQLETSLAGWARTDAAGTRTDVLYLGQSLVKYGLTDHSDLQIGFTPFVRIDTRAGGVKDHQSGIGDVVIRYKHRFTSPDAPVQAAVIPFVKIPTAPRGIGNRKAEGGLAVPVSFSPGGSVTITLGPELDLLADGDGHGHHVALVNMVNVAAPIAPRLTLVGELWNNLNFDTAGTVRQASADAALAYAASDRVQLDVGVNVGLTQATPDAEVYAGVSVRF